MTERFVLDDSATEPVEPGSRVVGLCVLGVGLAVAFSLHQVLRLRVFYWDSWSYLVESRVLLGSEGLYSPFHAPLPQLVLVPWQWWTEALPLDSPLHFVAPRLAAFAWSLGLLGLTFGWLRARRGSAWALFAALTLAANGLFIRYAAHPMVDIPSAFWVVGALWSYDRASRGEGAQLFAWAMLGLCFAGAILTKFSLLVLPLPFIASEMARMVRARRMGFDDVVGLALSGAVGAGVALVVVIAVHVVVFGSFDAMALFERLRGLTDNEWGEESPLDYLSMAFRLYSPVALLLVGAGLRATARRRSANDLAALLWLVVYGAVLGLQLTHNELRYAWPLAPVLAWLAMEGAYAGAGALKRRIPGGGSLLREGALLAVAVALAAPAVAQARADLDPFFRAETLVELVDFVDEFAGTEAPIFWEGWMIALTPEDDAPIPEDEFFNYFHFGAHSVEYLMRRPVQRVRSVSDPFRFLARRKNLESRGARAGDAPRAGEPPRGGVYIRASGSAFDTLTALAGIEAPREFVAHGLSVATLSLQEDRYVDRSGTVWFRVERRSGRLRLTPLRDLANYAIRLAPKRGGRLQTVAMGTEHPRGEELLTSLELGATDAPPSELQLERRAKRRFAAALGRTAARVKAARDAEER